MSKFYPQNYWLNSFYADSKNELTLKSIHAFISQRKDFNFNPLCIYGQHGTGKTHLLHAITYEMLVRGKKVYSTSGKGFGEDFVKAIIKKDLEGMRNFYREIDILVIDDVQYLSGKPKTQEEMTHTLISRSENKKITIFSSRWHPNRLQEFDDWLSSRIGMGLTLEVI